jgi:hypothetical protein
MEIVVREWNKVVACAVLWLASPAVAQSDSKLEIGTSLGIAVTFANGESVRSYGIPGAGSFGGMATLYFTTFVAPRVMVEPQIQLLAIAADDETVRVATGLVQLGYLLVEDTSRSPYVAIHGGVIRFSDPSSSDSMIAAGFALGQRWRIGPGGALRVEARFRRWIDEGIDASEIAFGVGVAGIFR